MLAIKEEGMPRIEVVFFAEADGRCPVLQWLDGLHQRVQDKCIVRIERLADLGHELRRPEADLLRDGIHELRVTYRRSQFRILYFFHGSLAVLAHGLIKERVVPKVEIERAIRRRTVFTADPGGHTYREP
jgi:phage-related protein